MPFSMSVQSGSDVLSSAYEAVEDQQEKTFFHSKVEEEERHIFKKKISVYELMRIPLIYIDASGFSEDMSRIFGYAPAGVRCFGKHDVMSKRRTNVVGALSEDKLLTTALF